MFEQFRQTLRDLMATARTPDDRREALARMRDTVVQARVGVADLRAALELTRKRLAHERAELETVRRRMELARGIGDAETVAVAERFERQHAERVAVLERKHVAQEEEVALAEREVAQMTQELKLAASGAGPSVSPPSDALGLGRDPLVDGTAEALERLERERRQAAADAAAQAKLDALKRRMGK